MDNIENMDIDSDIVKMDVDDKTTKYKEYQSNYRKSHKDNIKEYNQIYHELTKNSINYKKYTNIWECSFCHHQLQNRNMKRHLRCCKIKIYLEK